ncbi:hypothetical protein NA57DRAFT_55161 [Rhizodiscina lignyota]|uniref:Uncharacterized protein n=1 Tax=Rhizodiscina lignyota TaxID=1504668 RepID=A0A9P4IHF5_9PEZI|nr:hypothetical protein NA57DRAFT_55161 [Rhizodiscina lignyota]
MEFDDFFDLDFDTDDDFDDGEDDESVSDNSSDSDTSDTSSDGNGHISPMLGDAAGSFFKRMTIKEKKEQFLMAFSGNGNRSHSKRGRALRKMLRQVARIVNIQVGGKSRTAKSRMDTGADYNFVTRETLERCCLDHKTKLSRRAIPITLGDGTRITVRDKIELEWLFHNSDHVFQSTFFVIDEMPYDMIIGICECVKRGLITFNTPGKKFGSLTSTLSRKSEPLRLCGAEGTQSTQAGGRIESHGSKREVKPTPGRPQRRSDASQPPLPNNFHANDIGVPQDLHYPQNSHQFLHSQRPPDYLSRPLPTQEPVNVQHASHSENPARAARTQHYAQTDRFPPEQGPGPGPHQQWQSPVPGHGSSLAAYRYTQQPPRLSLNTSPRSNQEHSRLQQHSGYSPASSVSPHDNQNQAFSNGPNPQQHPSSWFQNHIPEQNGRPRQHSYPASLQYSSSTRNAQPPQRLPSTSSVDRNGLFQQSGNSRSSSVPSSTHYAEYPQGTHGYQSTQPSRPAQYAPLTPSSQPSLVRPSLQQSHLDQRASISRAPSNQQRTSSQQPPNTQQAASAQYIPPVQLPPPVLHQYPGQQPQSFPRVSPIHRTQAAQRPRVSHHAQTFPGNLHVHQPNDMNHPDFVDRRWSDCQ